MAISLAQPVSISLSPSLTLACSSKSRCSSEKVIEPSDIHLDIEAEPISPETSLPANVFRADGGKHAWMFLAGCFVFEALVWGFPFSFGVFQSYYSTHEPFSSPTSLTANSASVVKSSIAIIGTCSSGIMYLIAPLTLSILSRYPSIRRLCSFVGLVIAVLALIASSFAAKVWHLILTQGVLYAIGGSMLYSPTMFYLDEWFIERKGLAFGIMWAGVGTSGLIFPFLLSYLLDKLGHANTLRIWALILMCSCLLLIHYIKPRLPVPLVPPPRKRTSYKFLLRRTHIFLQAANILESLGFFMPAIYLPLYTLTLKLPTTTAPLLLSLLNISSVLGAVTLGHFCDTYRITTIILFSTIGSTLSVFFLWGFGLNIGVLAAFVLGYGLFAGGWSAIWVGMGKEVIWDEKRQKSNVVHTNRDVGDEVDLQTLMGIFAAGRGVGSVVSGPLSKALMGAVTGGGGRAWGYWGEYGVLIIFTGVTALCGLVGLGACRRKEAADLVGEREGSSDLVEVQAQQVHKEKK